MPFPDASDAPFPRQPAPLTVTEAQAALALGRLDGALAHCPEPAMRIFAGLMLQGTLIAALRQEGHAFTGQRFHAWFAGLVPLADATPRRARCPRALCDAMLTELGTAAGILSPVWRAACSQRCWRRGISAATVRTKKCLASSTRLGNWLMHSRLSNPPCPWHRWPGSIMRSARASALPRPSEPARRSPRAALAAAPCAARWPGGA